MCGRYTLEQKAKDIAKRFKLDTVVPDLKPNYNVAPSQIMPVVTEGQRSKRNLEMMQWGIPRTLGKDIVKELINTRADKTFGGFWKRTVMNHRCLIPATGFYEWKRSKNGKTPFFIHPKNVELYSFAGIWDVWKNEQGHEIKAYSIMTTEPNQEMTTIHNRMPVILSPKAEALWLDPSNDDQQLLAELLKPYEDGKLEIYQVSDEVNSPRNNYRSLLQAVS